MLTSPRLTLDLLLELVALTFAGGVVIRDDRDDADALRLAQPFDAAGRVLPDGGCTLIAPTWAVTAAHVAASIRPGTLIQFGEKAYTVKRTVIHPEGTGPEGVPPEVDLAMVELTEAVEDITPAALYHGHEELGKTLVIVGYGDYGTPSAGLHHTDGRRRAVTNVVDDAGPRRIFMRFDAPPGGTQYEGVGGPGDSGGPALLQDGGKTWLVGVSSASMNGRPGQYGVTDVYTRVSSYTQWIDQIITGR